MPQDVAVEIPNTGIVCIECDRDLRFWWDENCVAERPIQGFAVDSTT